MAKQNKKGIGWCDYTFNPFIGCTKISPACDNCYAETIAKRFFPAAKWGNHPRVLTSEANWRKPLAWNKRSQANFNAFEQFKNTQGMTDEQLLEQGFIKPIQPKVFCGSMCDVFDNQIMNGYRFSLFKMIYEAPHLTWLLLTKRIGNVEKIFSQVKDCFVFNSSEWPFANIWLGITVCNQEEADRDIPKLLQLPAAKRFLSIEPMLGYVDLSKWIGQIDWVIVGGETGHKARPLHPLWAVSIRDQCQVADVPFFFKQWGEWAPRGYYFKLEEKELWQIDPQCKKWPRVIRLTESGKNGRIMENCDGGEDVHMQRIGAKKAGCLLIDKEWKQFP